MKMLIAGLCSLAFAGLVHADGLKLTVKPPPGLPGPEVKIKVGDDPVKVKAAKGNQGKHKGHEKGKGNKH